MLLLLHEGVYGFSDLAFAKKASFCSCVKQVQQSHSGSSAGPTRSPSNSRQKCQPFSVSSQDKCMDSSFMSSRQRLNIIPLPTSLSCSLILALSPTHRGCIRPPWLTCLVNYDWILQDRLEISCVGIEPRLSHFLKDLQLCAKHSEFLRCISAHIMHFTICVPPLGGEFAQTSFNVLHVQPFRTRKRVSAAAISRAMAPPGEGTQGSSPATPANTGVGAVGMETL